MQKKKICEQQSWGRFDKKIICALRLTVCAIRPTFEKLFIGAKVQRKAQKIGVGCKTVNEIDPGP